MVAVLERPAVGFQPPRIRSVPEMATSRGSEVLELGRSCGLVADGWQADVVDAMFGFRADGLFSAFKVGVNVPRQNGKGVLLELRELGGVFVLGEELITHTSHMQDTSLEAMRRLVEALEEGGLSGELKSVRATNGQEALIFKSGQRIRFRTRSKGSGRGWAAPVVIFDEAMFIPEFAHDAMFPILSAQPNPQVIYTGSAVDQFVHEQGVVWATVREHGLAGDDPGLAYFEWSADFDDPDAYPSELDMDLVRQANPALGVRIREEYIASEHLSLGRRGFAVERGGVGDWPRTDGVEQNQVSVEDWLGLADPDSRPVGDVFFAVDVSPERVTSVAVAGWRDDGLAHVELAHKRGGTSWLAKWLVDRVERHKPAEVVCDPFGPVGSVLVQVREAGVDVREMNGTEHARACGQLVDAVNEKLFRHRGQEELLEALKGAKARPLGDAWAWSRKSSRTDISPLVAATLALSAALDSPGGWEPQVF